LGHPETRGFSQISRARRRWFRARAGTGAHAYRPTPGSGHAALKDSVVAVDVSLRESIVAGDAALKDSTVALDASLRAEIASAKIWALLLYLAFAATMLGTMARGFGWL